MYNGIAGIELRGAFSSSLPQKPYAFETRNALGNDSAVTLLGMPEESDWTLLANYNDKTFMRNALPFHLARQMGRTIGTFALVKPGDHVMVAVSGGKDSYTLLDLLWEARKKAPFSFDVTAVHLDQGQPG